jgi:hypothetical protein
MSGPASWTSSRRRTPASKSRTLVAPFAAAAGLLESLLTPRLARTPATSPTLHLGNALSSPTRDTCYSTMPSSTEPPASSSSGSRSSTVLPEPAPTPISSSVIPDPLDELGRRVVKRVALKARARALPKFDEGTDLLFKLSGSNASIIPQAHVIVKDRVWSVQENEWMYYCSSPTFGDDTQRLKIRERNLIAPKYTVDAAVNVMTAGVELKGHVKDIKVSEDGFSYGIDFGGLVYLKDSQIIECLNDSESESESGSDPESDTG